MAFSCLLKIALRDRAGAGRAVGAPLAWRAELAVVRGSLFWQPLSLRSAELCPMSQPSGLHVIVPQAVPFPHLSL